MQDIKYVKPTSVDEAVQLLQKGGSKARAFAGGTDLIVQARERKRDVNLFVDIKAHHGNDGAELRRGRRA